MAGRSMEVPGMGTATHRYGAGAPAGGHPGAMSQQYGQGNGGPGSPMGRPVMSPQMGQGGPAGPGGNFGQRGGPGGFNGPAKPLSKPSRAKVVRLSLILVGIFAFGIISMGVHSGGLPNPFNFATGRTVGKKGGTVAIGRQSAAPPPKGVSLVVVCMNRHSTLEQVMKFWLGANDIDEVILVDWNSDPPLSTVTKKYRDPRLVLARIEDEENWVLSRAFNIGMSLTTMDKILKLDCDYAIAPDFVKKHTLRKEDKKFYSGDYGKARDENEIHLNGVLYIRSEDFWGIYGYDERIQTYGWDDEDLYKRLDQSGLTRQVCNYDLVFHYPHGDSARGQKGVKFPQVEVDVNSLLVDKMELWSKGIGTDSSRYLIQGTKPGQVILKAKSVPKSLAKRSKQEEVDEVYGTALGRRLHDDYGIPWDLLSDLGLDQRELLVGDFITLSGKTGVGDVVLAKALMLHAVGSPLQRLVSVVYANSLAKASRRVLLVIWEQADDGAAFSDIFDGFVGVASQLRTPSDKFTEAAAWDQAYNTLSGFDLTMGKEEQSKLASANTEHNIYMKCNRFTFPAKEIAQVPLSADVLARVGSLGTSGMLGVVAQSVDDLNLLMPAIEEEKKKLRASVFVITKDKAVISALGKPVVGAISTGCVTSISNKDCATAIAVDAGALAQCEVVVAREGSDFALAAQAFREDVNIHFV